MSSDQDGANAGYATHQDHVDQILEEWSRQRPDLDVSPMGIIGRMSRLSRFLEHSIGEVLAGHGLNEPQFAVLAALRRAGPPHCLSPTDLYNSLLVSSGAMTNRLRRLEVAGLVKRMPDPHDGRGLLVALTRKGQRVIDEAVDAHTANEHRLLAALTPADRETLAHLLRRLLLQFEDHLEPTQSRRPAPDGLSARSSPRRSAGAGR
ncbi:MAG TPA: MarR family transcriptional regulator [Actinomycetota bacterium]|jgi:DNA-binding MarR family transcriptional regulator|nr:MarR family transcriptional regulator [Actinomycetota bacterium]